VVFNLTKKMTLSVAQVPWIFTLNLESKIGRFGRCNFSNWDCDLDWTMDQWNGFGMDPERKSTFLVLSSFSFCFFVFVFINFVIIFINYCLSVLSLHKIKPFNLKCASAQPRPGWVTHLKTSINKVSSSKGRNLNVLFYELLAN